MKPAIVFRRIGKRIFEDDINANHKSINVYRQKMHKHTQKLWPKKTLAQAMKGSGDHILFYDNLEGKNTASFHKEVQKSEGIVWYGVKNATYI